MKVSLPPVESLEFKTPQGDWVIIYFICLDDKTFTYTVDYTNRETRLRAFGEVPFPPGHFSIITIPKIIAMNRDNPQDTIEEFFKLTVLL